MQDSLSVGRASEDREGSGGETGGHDGLPVALHGGRVVHHSHIGLLLLGGSVGRGR